MIGEGIMRVKKRFNLDDIELEDDYSPPPVDLSRYQQRPLPFPKTEAKEVEIANLHPSVAKAYHATLAWCKAIKEKEEPYWLFLYGGSGCGKTFFAQKAANYLVKQNFNFHFANWAISFADFCDQENMRLAIACRTHALFLDDIGTGYTLSDKAAELHESKLYEILETRRDKFTLITSNLSTQHIADRFSARIASRLGRDGNVKVNMSQADDYWYIKKSPR